MAANEFLAFRLEGFLLLLQLDEFLVDLLDTFFDVEILLGKERFCFLPAGGIRRIAIERPVGRFLQEEGRDDAEDGCDHEVIGGHVDVFGHLHQPGGYRWCQPRDDDRDIKGDCQSAVADAGREEGG